MSVPALAALDIAHLRDACGIASKCSPVPSAYNVGAVIVSGDGVCLATGFSREIPGNTHAEEVALNKVADTYKDNGTAHVLGGATLYTSMEPCSNRLSGKESCTQLILAAGIKRVVMAIAEPPNFVQCTGAQTLRSSGVEVIVAGDADCERLARAANSHLLGS